MYRQPAGPEPPLSGADSGPTGANGPARTSRRVPARAGPLGPAWLPQGLPAGWPIRGGSPAADRPWRPAGPHPGCPRPERRGGAGYVNSGDASSDAMLISLIRMLIEGPAVSLNGSPTVSPTTAALCTSLPLPPRWPASMYFLALSHEPPALAMNSAIMTPDASEPASRPPTADLPKIRPSRIGDSTASRPGATICRSAPCVEIVTQRA